MQHPEPIQAIVACADDDFIKSRIFTIRGVQVVLDRDLVELYGVQTMALNQAVKRNANRFPSEFMFALAKDEEEELVTNCDRFASVKHSSVPMRAFSEHGVIMVASVLKSEIAAQISVRIVRVFVAMRKALASIAPMMARLEVAERRQIVDQQRNEERFETIFKAMDGGDFPPQKVFFEGKHYDAPSFAKKLMRKAAKKIVLVDGYCDEVTLDILAQKKGGVEVVVATAQKMIDAHLTPVAIAKFIGNSTTRFHGRFFRCVNPMKFKVFISSVQSESAFERKALVGCIRRHPVGTQSRCPVVVSNLPRRCPALK